MRTELTAALLLASCGTAFAISPAVTDGDGLLSDPVDGVPHFLEIDTNDDGLIDRQEARAIEALHASFDAIDKDSSGAIDPVEYADALSPAQ